MRLALLACSLGLVAACTSPRGSFPSLSPRAGEQERLIAEPGAGITPALAGEQQESFRADLARESALLAATEAALRPLGTELDRTLVAARGTSAGDDRWSAAQMALSRYDQARSPFGEIEARLAPLARIVDSLPPADADRQALETLSARVQQAGATAAARVSAASRQLGG